MSFTPSNAEFYTIGCFNVDTMIPTVDALLVWVVFLCGLETILSQDGHCTGNQCFALFQEPKDFPGAQKSCEDSWTGGQLFKFSSTDMETILTSLPSGLSGSYWLELRNTGSTTGLQNCSSISVTMGRKFTVLWAPCRENLNGFLCQYTFNEACSDLQAGGGAQVKYTAPMGFKVHDSETFPRGTIAVAETVFDKHPDTKHVCFSSDWLRAPWNCEVMQGGCEHSCNSTTHTCTCPAGRPLHPNKISCIADPCSHCAHECQREGDTYACKCNKGYRLARDGRGCVDVNECEEEDPCTGEGEECENTQGDFSCRCKDGFDDDDGVCVDVSICENCEHMLCVKFNGVYGCACRKGHRVSARDPTKCERHCTEKDCTATCIQNPDNPHVDMLQCFCPDGYILDINNSTAICRDINECEQEKLCDHRCVNLLGGFRCLCDEGFKLHKDFKCVPIEEEQQEEEEGGSGSTTPYPTAAGVQPAAVPSYIKAGSVLGISVFLVLCAALLFFLVHNVAKCCGRFDHATFKHPRMDNFYLQQVTTETYKRLSFDRQSKNDSQGL